MQFHQTSSASYDFRRNFDSIVRPGLIRFLDISADLLGNQFDADRRAGYTKAYVLDLRRALASEQKFANFREGIEPSPPMGSPPGTPPYIHPPWNAERAAAIAAEFEADVIDCERRGAADTKPVDIYRAVHLGTEMARKQNADGNLPFPIDVGPEAIAYAADRLKSKIERNAVHNPIGEVHEGLLSYGFRKTMPGGEKVVYIDSYKLRREAIANGAQRSADATRLAAPSGTAQPRVSGAAASRFALTWLSDIALDLDDEWLFKQMIPKVGAVSVFGDSMSFKTFLLIYIAVCASMGKDIAGYRCKNKGPVVYVAAEDAKGVEKRLVGYCLAHNIPQSDVHIAIIKAAPNLGTVKGDAIPLAKAIDEQLAAKGYDNPSAIVVDTLNQTLGDADENGAGMQAFMANATLLANGFSCPVLAANHVGHTEKDRERGGSQIKGNADTRLQVERVSPEPVIVNGVKTFETLIHARKVKNGEDGFTLKATLRQLVMGKDSDGDDVTTLVVDRVERMDGESKPKKAGRPSPKLEARRDGFLEAYHQLANDVEPVWGPDRRTKVRKVPVGAIHERMRSAGLLDDDLNGRRFSDLKLEMVAPKTGRFIERDGMVWLVYPEERPFVFRTKDEN